MTQPQIPAPERDLANEESRIPPASTDQSPLTISLFGWFAILAGAAVIVMALLALAFRISPLPEEVFNSADSLAIALAIGCGVALVGCGITIKRRLLLVPALLLAAALAMGVLSTLVD